MRPAAASARCAQLLARDGCRLVLADVNASALDAARTARWPRPGASTSLSTAPASASRAACSTTAGRLGARAAHQPHRQLPGDAGGGAAHGRARQRAHRHDRVHLRPAGAQRARRLLVVQGRRGWPDESTWRHWASPSTRSRRARSRRRRPRHCTTRWCAPRSSRPRRWRATAGPRKWPTWWPSRPATMLVSSPARAGGGRRPHQRGDPVRLGAQPAGALSFSARTPGPDLRSP
jgi:hypothetical protein